MSDRELKAILSAVQDLQSQVQSLKKEIADLKTKQRNTHQQAMDIFALMAKSQNLSKTQSQLLVDQWHSLPF